MTAVSKVLVIGSGPIVIGQAAEFDYAGTQACKALREEGVTSVLVNSNPATIMTDSGIADVVYIEPLTVEVLERVIARERPDGLLPTLGGQTGLNLAVELADAGITDRYGVRLLGTPLSAIRQAEDRALFKQMLQELGEPVPRSVTITSLPEARRFAAEIGLPLVVRPAYTLGGTGGGIAHTSDELHRIVEGGLAASPIRQVLLEESLLGWKEIEYEVMRDAADTCITVCNMENFDPMGVHTGDSIVVAPSQTLSDKEYQMLRSASLRIIRALGIEGGCNIQLALAPRRHAYAQDDELPPYYVIEVNPRVSRSSALASKATGYPIARVAAKIAVGRRLDEIPNAVTARTTAAFEPALDYCVVKIPRWPFDKFARGDRTIGTQMKATGEVMAIDRSFEAALQKAVRGLELGGRTLLWEDPSWQRDAPQGWRGFPLHAHDQRLWAVMAALRRGARPAELEEATGGIDVWFLTKLEQIVQMERGLLGEALGPRLLRDAKRLGFSDEQIGTLADRLPEQVRELREAWGIRPVYKMVDTCAAEFDAVTAYYYSCYETENEAPPLPGAKALVIGSGPIRIGQGIEFDYCSVHAAWALQRGGRSSIMVNSNPETVSTDFDTSNRLYFEALDEESVRDILQNEGNDAGPPPSIVQFGGQTAISLAGPLARAGLPIVGSSAEAIDLAEDRQRFADFLSRLAIPQPPGAGVHNADEALAVADLVGYPVVVRPSYVLGGRAMEIVHSPDQLERYVRAATELDRRHPVLIDKYLEGREVEVDAICDGERVLIPGIMEHVERAGVHSGDSMAVYPPVHLSEEEVAAIVEYTQRIGLEMQVSGLMNVQYVVLPPGQEDPVPLLAKEGLGEVDPREPRVFVLEVNPRASRTVPFLSKVTGVPMVQAATLVTMGTSLAEQGYEGGLWPLPRLVAVKAPVFSMAKLIGVDTYLGPEMKSTGEVMGVDFTYRAALIKALEAAGMLLLPGRGVLVTVADRDKVEVLPLACRLANLGLPLYATEGTAAALEAAGLQVTLVAKPLAEGSPTAMDLIQEGLLGGVINTLAGSAALDREGFLLRRAAAEARVPCYTSLDTARAAIEGLEEGDGSLSVQPLSEYLAGPGRPGRRAFSS